MTQTKYPSQRNVYRGPPITDATSHPRLRLRRDSTRALISLVMEAALQPELWAGEVTMAVARPTGADELMRERIGAIQTARKNSTIRRRATYDHAS